MSEIKLANNVWIPVTTENISFQVKSNDIRYKEADSLPSPEDLDYFIGKPGEFYDYYATGGVLYMYSLPGARVAIGPYLGNIEWTEENPIPTKAVGSSAVTAFGEKTVARNIPLCGWAFNYNMSPGVVKEITLNGGTVVHSGNMAVCSSGTDSAGVAIVMTVAALVYTPGIGGKATFSCIFDTPVENSLQVIGIGDYSDGLFFGYNGLKFGVMRRALGVDNWIYQEDWSEDTKPSLIPQKLNVYDIKFQHLGGGMQYFAVEDSDSGEFRDVHRIKYANLYTETSLDIPSLPISMAAVNFGNTSPIEIKSPSAQAFSQGEPFPETLTVPLGYEYSAAVSIGDNYLFTILNPATYEGKDNHLYIEASFLTLSVDGGKDVSFFLLLNPTLTGASYADIETGYSPAQVDEAAVAYSGGINVQTFTVAKDSSEPFNLKEILPDKLWAENHVTLACNAKGTGSTVSISFSMRSRV